ncbi:MAG TPA: molybdate ABC transporter substrate-binding protein [Anaerolineales bacterium]|nr:molybdate ABC transporter substrate-binding protein [Anaerolineales bacterium]
MKARHTWWIPFLMGGLALGGCTPAGLATAQAEPQSLVVFAAASLGDTFRELGDAFETAHPGVTVLLNVAGSQALRAQIEEGAEADVFAPASRMDMEALIGTGKVIPPGQDFATNSLIIIVPPDNPKGITTPQDLARPGIRLVLAAEEVPVGRYARESLARMAEAYGTSFADAVLVNVVSNEENVRQVVAKVQLGEADAGIVYATDALSAPTLGRVWIPEDQNVMATYPIAALSDSSRPDLAAQFIAFVLSPDGQAALRRWGFGPPP